MQTIKDQDQYADLVAKFKKDGGKVTECQPAAAKGNEMSRATRDTVRKTRADWRRDNG